MYKCFYCQKELTDVDINKRIICPFCSARILFKVRPKGIVTKVKAR
ncbi:MAG: DNA-directed RNA polymerase subunit P [Candidatus Nanoarchaeia archaeon]